jgi:hypothetical protein
MKLDPIRDAGLISIRRGLIGNVLALLTPATILISPPGSAIRPMHEPILLLVVAVITASSAWPMAVRALRSRGQVAQGIFGLLLGASPLFVGLIAFLEFVRLFRYTLKP